MKRVVDIGGVKIGGNNPIAIQSMTNTKTDNVDKTLDQLRALFSSGADIVRVSTNTLEACKALKEIKKQINKPIIADIHFNSNLAIEAIKNGADKIRINPGNMMKKNLDSILEITKFYNKPIRIGVNSGSINKIYQDKYGYSAKALFLSIKDYIEYFESKGFYNIVLSAKSSNVKMNIEVNRMLDKHFDYPIHVGVTEAGIYEQALIKSAIGIGSLLADSIGNTIRVSITGDPTLETGVAKDILKGLGLIKSLNIISCPTCARCDIDLEKMVRKVKSKLDEDLNITIAIMGCAVNGPGEAKHADIGIAGNKDKVIIFKKGKSIGTYTEEKAIEVLLENIEEMKCYLTE